MKIKCILIACLVMAARLSSANAQTLTLNPWLEKDLYDPGKLVGIITDSNPSNNPAIFNVGPVSNIKGAIELGEASKEEGLIKLKKQLSILPKDKEVIIYCGCCPFTKCPNIRPAFTLLKSEGFTHGFILNLPNNIQKDWISKGYPVDQE